MLLVFQTMLNLHLFFVNITSFLVKLFVNSLVDSQNVSRRIISFRSSNNYSGIVKSSLLLLKYSVVFLIKILGKPADKNFLITRFNSKLKSYSIQSLWHYVYIWLEFLKTNTLKAF